MNFKQKISAALAVTLLFALSGCSFGDKPLPKHELLFETDTFSFDQETYPSSSGFFSEYHIMPGDVLDVLFQMQTWRENEDFAIAIDHTVSVKFVHAPELNESQQVQPNGRISLPYLGEIYVVNLTATQLQRKLSEAYSRVLKDPQIYVTIPEFRSRIKELKRDLHTAPRGLSRLVTVRPDGYATFPLVGDLFVADRSFPQTNQELDRLYGDYLPGLHVDLFLEKHSGAVVYVLGQVAKPGAYKVFKPLTTLQALSLAGGTQYNALMEQVIVFRRHEGRVVSRTLDLRKKLTLHADEPFFYLRPDDILYVPKTALASRAEIMRDVADLMMFRGWGSSIDVDLFNEGIIK